MKKLEFHFIDRLFNKKRILIDRQHSIALTCLCNSFMLTSPIARKLELFYQEVESKREENGKKMKLQTHLEFQQHEFKKLNKKYNVDMFSTKIRDGKAFAAKQKIREFKKLLFKSKRLHKATKTGRVEPRKD